MFRKIGEKSQILKYLALPKGEGEELEKNFIYEHCRSSQIISRWCYPFSNRTFHSPTTGEIEKVLFQRLIMYPFFNFLGWMKIKILNFGNFSVDKMVSTVFVPNFKFLAHLEVG